jgi:hypothetical protein
MSPHTLGQHLRTGIGRTLMGAVLILGLGASGCGGGSSGSSSSPDQTGEVVIGLTDAPGDFHAYSVDVVSITLTKASGAVVETLPLSPRVDFAQLTELTEFITAATIPSGVYTAATIRLDYSNADIQVEDATGNIVAAVARDASGNPITVLDLKVRLDNRRGLVIAPGVPAHLTLDFNLAMTNSVDLVVSPPVVTVEPFLVAEVEPEAPKTHRVRGPLKSVNTAASSYEAFVRPFHVLRGEFGSLTVHTADTTAFEIDGTAYSGAAGLAALAAKPVGTATVAVGALNMAARRFEAQEVYAGSSVAWGSSDVVTGNVIARSGDTLTLRGATLVRADGSFSFRDTMTVLIGDATKVTRQLSTTPATRADISIGSRATVFGTMQAGGSTLDATNGLARLLLTTLTGTVNGTSAGHVELTLQTIDGRPIPIYSFAGTGSTAADDADPAHYDVATGSLSLSGLSGGTPVRVRGFVQPFGAAPEDFDAQTVVNVGALPAWLGVNWAPTAAAPFASVTPSSLTLDLTGVGDIHHVLRGGVLTDLVGLGMSPTLQPASAVYGLYAIGDAGTVTVYTQFDDYSAALSARLAAGSKARALGAHGTFTDATVTLGAGRVFAAFE